VRSPYPDVEIPEVTLADYVWRDVQKWEDNVALVIQFYFTMKKSNFIISSILFCMFKKIKIPNVFQVCGMTGRQYTYGTAYSELEKN